VGGIAKVRQQWDKGVMTRFVLIFLISLCACQTAPKSFPNAEGVPPVGESAQTAQPAGPPATHEVPRVTLVLGPGGAKAMAHAGVIKALQENRIPISRVIGIEWGALVGAAFTAHGQFHEIEWKLYKLDQVDLSGSGGFLGLSHDRNVKMLDGFFKENFAGLNIESQKVPFSCPARSFSSGVMMWQRKGPVTDALKRCLPFPPLFQVGPGWLAASTHIREIITALRNDGTNSLIIFVDVLGNALPFSRDKLQGQPMASLLWQDIQRSVAEGEALSGEVIRVPTEGVFIDRFDQRKDLISAGEAEGAKAAQRLSAKYGF
jgi:hypothetical protein